MFVSTGINVGSLFCLFLATDNVLKEKDGLRKVRAFKNYFIFFKKH